MDSVMSLKKFKQQYLDRLLEIHWKQWSALGVSAQVRPEERRIIDLEALVLSTLGIGLHDTRLLGASAEWLTEQGRWLNLPRFKRLSRYFTVSTPGIEERIGPPLHPAAVGILGEALARRGKKSWIKEFPGGAGDNGTAREYKNFFSGLKKRGIVTEPVLSCQSLLQLRLRGMFGVDARAELLIYLLNHEGGNSNSIAREIFFNQRNVYQILGEWHRSGMLVKTDGARATTFSLKDRDLWADIADVDEETAYLNWGRMFHVLDQVAGAFMKPEYGEDEYMLSSLFRDVRNEMVQVARVLGVHVPEPGRYPGANYFDPFASALLDVLAKLME